MDYLRRKYLINDLPSTEDMDEEIEHELRRKVAAAYRLVDLFGWSEGIYNHITARVPSEKAFLINPFGLQMFEISAASLVKIGVNGEILERGRTGFGINNRGFVLHSAIHMERPDVNAIVHCHIPEVIAVSSMCRYNPYRAISQEGILLGDIAFHKFNGVLTDLEERRDIASSLRDSNVLLLENHGFLACGETVEAAMLRAFFFVYDVKAQVSLNATNCREKMVSVPSEDAVRRSQVMNYGEKSGRHEDKGAKSYEEDQLWQFGELDWEAWMRMLDSMRVGFNSHPESNHTQPLQEACFWSILRMNGSSYWTQIPNADQANNE